MEMQKTGKLFLGPSPTVSQNQGPLSPKENELLSSLRSSQSLQSVTKESIYFEMKQLGVTLPSLPAYGFPKYKLSLPSIDFVLLITKTCALYLDE